MRITNRLYTYPVLNDDKDDYQNSMFHVVQTYEMVGADILKLSFDINLECDTLQGLINSNQAEFMIHMECSGTAYRETLISASSHLEKTLLISRVNGTMEFVAFIIAKNKLVDFYSDEWVEDYKETKFDLEKGAVLAFQNVPGLDITKDYEEFSNANSIFKIYKRHTSEDKAFDVDMESKFKIKIGLGEKEYNIYNNFCGKIQFQSILNTMIILPALVFVFVELRQEGGIEKYRTRNWYVALEKSYMRHGMNFENELCNTDKKSIELAQEAMQLPISKALKSMVVMYEEEEE